MYELTRLFLTFFCCISLFCTAIEDENLKIRVTPSDGGMVPVRSMIEGNNRFTFDFYRSLMGEKRNICFSPYSMTIGLSMAASGAAGETGREFQQVLHYSLSFLPAISDLNALFFNQDEGVNQSLFMADSLWINKHLPLHPSYEKFFDRYFNQLLQTVDFLYDKAGSIRKINQWTTTETNNKIRDMLTGKDANAHTQLILTTAMSIKAKWVHPFDSKKTSFLPFYTSRGAIQVDMMQTISKFPIWKGEKMSLAALPYVSIKNMKLAMVFIVPNEGVPLETVENELTWDTWEKGVKNLREEEVKFIVPRFRVENRLDMRPALEMLGLKSAFLKEADFSGMTDEKEIFISEAIHKTVIKIDEGGSDAGGAIAAFGASDENSMQFKIERPFIFIVLDLNSGAIFYMGKIMQP